VANCLYICGAGHSGSTLLDMLLGCHSKVASLGEISNLPMDWATNNRCTCGKHVRECELWTGVVGELSAKLGINAAIDPYALNLGPIYAAVGDKRVTNGFYLARRRVVSALHLLELHFQALGILRLPLRKVYSGLANTLELYELVGSKLGADWVVDSSKVYTRAVSLYRMAPDRMKIILLIRDGRAVYCSMRKRNFSRRFSLNAWYAVFLRALPLIDKHVDAGDVITVKYESLASDPARELKRICDFAGLEFEPGMLDLKSKLHHNINGNDMRFATASEIRLDTKWRSALDADELAYFEGHAGWLNNKLGYQ
jgi:hypothetical protein